MKSVLVTGCAGFIGSHLSEELLKKGWHVYGIDNFHPYYSRKLKEHNMENLISNTMFNFINGSILSSADLENLPNDIDYVFHFAAIAGVRNSILHPEEYFKINVEGTQRLLDKYHNIKNFIFASSSSVYGDLDDSCLPVQETHSLKPISPYGESKRQAEDICIKSSKDEGRKTTILRFYTVYGPRQRPDEAITKFIRLAQTKKPIPIYGDGTKERDFTFVSDIVNGSILAAEKGNGVYNLGTGKPISVNDLIKSIEFTMNTKFELEYVESPEGDVQKTHADTSKAALELGYKAKYNLQKGISECVKWCMNTQDLIKESVSA